MNPQTEESGYKLFGFIDKKFRDSISAFLLGAVFSSFGWFVFYSAMRSLYENSLSHKTEVINEYKQRLLIVEQKLDMTEEQLNEMDEECASRVSMYNSLYESMRSDISATKAKSMSLADKEVQSIKQLGTIENEIKSKIK